MRIGTTSIDLRPSHNTTTLALLAVTRSTTPRRAVQTNMLGRLLLLNTAAARAVSFTMSSRLIIFSPQAERPHRHTVGSENPSKRKPDNHVVSSHCPVLPIDISLASSADSVALMRYQNGLHQSLVIARQ